MRKKSHMELLAPAGSLPAFEAAFAQGADAVYIGAPQFNARALSRDFSLNEIAAMVKYAHRRKKKVYMAMNSLVKEEEIGQLVELLSALARLKPDGLIVQDLGLASLARQYFPGLVLHASTLMSVHNSLAAGWLAEQGFQRVVLARELTLDEIEQIGKRSGVELEVFIHGAMCFSYSGLCLFSSLHGGKSSMRGKCVQPCRRRYGYQAGRGDRVKGGGYLFSMNDLSAISLLNELQLAGVVSLKIEGRLKSVQYVSKTVQAYRLVLDSLPLSEQEQAGALAEAQGLLDEAMGRKRASGFFLGSRPKQAVTPAVSGNTGILLGRVVKVMPAGRGNDQLMLHITLNTSVQLGERLRVHDESTGERQSFTLKNLQVAGKSVRSASAGQTVRTAVQAALLGKNSRKKGQLVFRVDIQTKDKRNREGESVRIGKVQPASQRDQAEQRKILQGLFWEPIKEKGKEKSRSLRGAGNRKAGRQQPSVAWWIRLRSPEAIKQKFPVRPARFLIPLHQDTLMRWEQSRDRLGNFRDRMIWCLPPVIGEAQVSWYGQAVARLQDQGVSRFQLAHISQLLFFSSKGRLRPDVELYGDYTLNILNSVSLANAQDCGLRGVQFSLETDRQTLAGAVRHFLQTRKKQGHVQSSGGMKVGMYVFGRPPLFTARLEGEHIRLNQPVVSPKRELFRLEREGEMTLARAEAPFTLLSHRAELQNLGLSYLVADLSGGPLKRELALFSTLLRPGRGRQPVTLQGNYAGTLL